jgi:uncharacterized phiE125 gp8 family phage protein
MAGLALYAVPATEPVSLDGLKDHLRITDSSEDELLTGYGIAARQTLEGDRYPGLGISLITQTWDLFLDSFPPGIGPIIFPKPPLQTVTSVSWFDIHNTETVLDVSTYQVDNTTMPGEAVSMARIFPVNGWPGVSLRPVNGVKVRAVEGFGDKTTDIPTPLALAICQLTGTFFEFREASAEIAAKCLPYNFDTMTGLYRRDGT